MFVYNNSNNNHQTHKKATHTDREVSKKRSAKVKLSSPKRRKHKQGKSLHKVNTQFLKSLGFIVRKRQK